MRLLRLDPGNAFKKCSRIVGDVMGKYHPHGNLALYDALVRLAQAVHAALPAGRGARQFGNIDGDNGRAERYTEARLTKTAIQLMEGLDDGTVNFVRPTTTRRKSPKSSPACSPTCSPMARPGSRSAWRPRSQPQRRRDHRRRAGTVENPHVEHARLMELFHGPDFATGGVIIDSPEAISGGLRDRAAAFRVRGRFHACRVRRTKPTPMRIERLGGGSTSS